MSNRCWFVNAQGQCQSLGIPKLDRAHPYRLHRFLTELEDLSCQLHDEPALLQALAPRFLALIQGSPWLGSVLTPPDPQVGWSAVLLYDEPDYPFTLQTVVWAPGQGSPVHGHGTWAMVALMAGQQEHRFWQQAADQLTPTGTCTLAAGDVLLMSSTTCHQVNVSPGSPAISLNLYGPGGVGGY
ncbi:MAG: hypothetical protein Q6J68_05075 [Thermostichales cyanobacterium SZTDM-1c_bins_54]